MTIEPELLEGTRAWSDVQRGGADSGVTFRRVSCSWAGTTAVPRGAFAVVAADGALADLVGDYVRVSFEGRTGDVYVAASADGSLDDPLVLSRRAFAALTSLATSQISVTVAVL